MRSVLTYLVMSQEGNYLRIRNTLVQATSDQLRNLGLLINAMSKARDEMSKAREKARAERENIGDEVEEKNEESLALSNKNNHEVDAKFLPRYKAAAKLLADFRAGSSSGLFVELRDKIHQYFDEREKSF